jgi:hypothetical protein
VEGSHAGQKIAVEKSPFVIGRARGCDLQIVDKRASGKHAKILQEGGAYYIEDLGSTNGTALNNRPVQRAGLRSGALIQIGNTSFRAAVPPGAAPPREAAAAGAPRGGAEEEFVRFDVEKFMARDRSQHPLAVVALVVILAVVGYFAVDITLRVARRPIIDPPPEANLIAANWSFEDVPGEPGGAAAGRPGVPGWRVAEGDQGAIATTAEHAQLPGNLALRLTSEGDEDLCRAVCERDIVLTEGGSYRLEGFIANERAFAAGLLVEWLRSSGEGSVLTARSFSETARQPAEAVDVDQVFTAPRESNVARVCLFVIGERGSAVFDRISFRHAGAPAEGAKEPGEPRLVRSFKVGDEASFQLAAGADGLFSLARGRRAIITALWAGLAPDLDPLAFGPRLAAVRVGNNDSSSVLYVGEVPDQKESRWVTIETTMMRAGQDVLIRWRAAPAEGAPAPALCIHLDTHEKHTAIPAGSAAGEDAAKDLVKEVSLGAREDRAVLAFGAPVRLASRAHPADPGRSLLVGEAAGGEIEVVISAGSRHEAALARDHIRAAEDLYRSGQPGAAMEAIARTRDLYPDQKGEIARADERLAGWKSQASEALASLRGDLKVLRETEAPVVKAVLLERASLFKARHAGTSLADEAASLIKEVESFWAGREAARAEKDADDLAQKGRKHLDANDLGLAELYFRAVVEADEAGPRGREASRALDTIKSRRQRDTRIRLAQ